MTKRTKTKLIRAAVSLVLSAFGVTMAASPQARQKLLALPSASSPGLYHVTKVIDGDTIEVNMAGKTATIRYIGIDTPETHDPRKPVQCFGQIAAAKNKSLVDGRDVRLEADPNDSNKDKYGRYLRYIYLPDGTLVNAELVKQGYAFAYVVFPFAKIDEFRADEAAARQQNKGLWAGCDVDSSSLIKQTTTQK